MNRAAYVVGPIENPLEDYASIAGESLLCTGPGLWETYVDRVGRGNLRGVYDGARLAGGMAFYRTAQWFGGKEIPCAGISGVAINAADRGSGACATLMRGVLGELHREGIPLASLYASTQYLYRTFGFEHAGTQTQYEIPISSIHSSDRTVPIHRFDSPPIDRLHEVSLTRAIRGNGHLSRTHGLWQRQIDPAGGNGTVTYLIGDADAPEGFVILRTATRDGGVPQPLVSTDLVANTPASMHRLLTLIRDHRSMCDSFQWYGAPQDPLIFLADEQWVTVKSCMRWMLRIIDLPAAIERRGYDRSASGTLDLEIEDELQPENAGRWRVVIDSGTANIRRGGSGSLRMDIRALAPLYSSFYTADQLVRLGVIWSGDDGQLSLATRAFGGEPPWLTEVF
jgi:predicted acetyltransferase